MFLEHVSYHLVDLNTFSLLYCFMRRPSHLTDDAEGHRVLGRALSVSHHHGVRARVSRRGLRELHTAVFLTASDRYPLPSNHHLRRKRRPKFTPLVAHKLCRDASVAAKTHLVSVVNPATSHGPGAAPELTVKLSLLPNLNLHLLRWVQKLHRRLWNKGFA